MKLLLDSDWRLTKVSKVNRNGNNPERGPSQFSEPDSVAPTAFSIPGDVHSALLAAGHIDDPYYRNNELVVDWVHQCQWQIERKFNVDSLESHTGVLMLDQVDCLASIYVNDTLVGTTSSQFIRYTFNISDVLEPGENAIRIVFDSASVVARQKAKDFPFVLPASDNCRVPHSNMLRKTPCHAGWDWNICLMPVGVYGEVALKFFQTHFIEDVKFEQVWNADNVTLMVSAGVHAYQAINAPCRLEVAGVIVESTETLKEGVQQLQWQLDIQHPDKWWPAGSGGQKRYTFTLHCADQSVEYQIGFRDINIVRTPDDKGSGFQFVVNRQAIFMRGANWIPADALPQRIDLETVRELLLSAVDANMNMLRVWGGGQYESDWFYDLCDELGILVWQDFMFSCGHYPAADSHWLSQVKTEAQQQVRRLSKHPCVALWCGDNELVGALKWWEITRDNRDRYLANYSRLNHTVETATRTELSDTEFWPSSPSVGYMDFGDGWKNDAAGDMHFWDVWHEAQPFSAYQDIHPRFCSEFGFQSFPSMPMMETFTEHADRNVSSQVMETHQRNVGGNARIVETLVRYFEFPDSFERMVFLSQCQQAMAIKTAVEYWRSLKPHCMGTLYWQLNDTWPVASWSSLEYAGAWKLLHYAARRFYQPMLVVMVPENKKFGSDATRASHNTGQLLLKVVNDYMSALNIQVNITAHDIHGNALQTLTHTVNAPANSTLKLCDFGPDADEEIAFYRWVWSATADSASAGTQNYTISGENEYWLKAYKNFTLPQPTIQHTAKTIDGQHVIELQTDKPAFYVTLNLGGHQIFSDNGFTLLPGELKQVVVNRELANQRVPRISELHIQHL